MLPNTSNDIAITDLSYDSYPGIWNASFGGLMVDNFQSLSGSNANSDDVQSMAGAFMRSGQDMRSLSEQTITRSGIGARADAFETHRLVKLADEELQRRAHRTRYLSQDYFGEPAWTMLLDLFVCEHRDRRVSTTSACNGSQSHSTTALRWLDILEQNDLIAYYETAGDNTGKLIALTKQGSEAVRSILSSYGD